MGVFSRGVPIANQFQVLFTCIYKLLQNISFQVVLTFVLKLCRHLFSSCDDICFQVVMTFVFKLLFTSCYKLVHVVLYLQAITMYFEFMHQHVRK